LPANRGSIVISRLCRQRWTLLIALALQATHVASADQAPAAQQLSGMSLQQLSSLQVTSVSKSTEPLSQAPASIYVITHDDILQSGATTIVEALRLAPNLLVTRTTSSSFAVAARGLGGNAADQNFSNKLLVLIDGRSVYSPLYSGVYLDVQDVVMDDIDRIEVISGPGATLWGANAMNGVINIITRSAYVSEGGLVQAAAGNQQQMGSVRYGFRLSDQSALRVYGKEVHDASEAQPNAPNPGDNWNRAQTGFRLDWAQSTDSVTLQGDTYRGLEHAAGQTGALISGGNLLARWSRTSGSHQWQIQTYFDQTERGSLNGGDGFALRTYDVSLQENLAWGSTQRIVWGAGYRLNGYDIASQPDFQWNPGHRVLTLANLFAQDTISLTNRLNVTGGIKFEDDPYAGWQAMPDARAALTLSPSALLWASASRAVRSPTPFDEDVLEYVPPLQLSGDRNFLPESVWDEDLGIRVRPMQELSVSATAFHDDYRDLRSILLSPPAVAPILVPLTWGNTERATINGLELWATWRVSTWWQLSPAWREVHENFSFVPGLPEIVGPLQAGDDPGTQASLSSSMQWARGWGFAAMWRYVGALPSPVLPAYDELDARVIWRASSRLELALKGSNLLHARHLETPLASGGEYIDRAIMAQAVYRPSP
jgi:iron complex outermembrane receptor protein